MHGRFDPPAPLALVTVKSERPDLVVEDVPMLLDTGADVSLLPRSSLAQLVSPDANLYSLRLMEREAPPPRSALSCNSWASPSAVSSC